jgi:GT2 family glycosyltransferase
MTDYPKAFISILNWNGLVDTLECLESVYKMDYPNFEVIVVDNASSDDSVSVIKEKYPQAILIESKENIGFTGGNNIAMRYAMEHDAEYVWLLNNDTTVERDAMTALMRVAQSSPSIGLISSQVHYHSIPDIPQFAGSYVDWELLEIEVSHSKKTKADPIFQTGSDVCLWGTALLIKRSVIDNIGYLDDRYFAYWEDTDYSIRSLKAGYKNVLCPESIIFHKNLPPQGQARTPHYYFYIIRNEYFLKNNILKGKRNFDFKRKYFSKVFSLLSFIVKHKDRNAALMDAVTAGAWNGMQGQGGPMSSAKDAPLLFRWILALMAAYPPYFWSYLLDGNISLIFKKGSGKLGWRRN